MDKKISVKKFCENYVTQSNTTLREQYLKKTLKIVPYVSFLKKDALAESILKVTMYDRKTGEIKVNSSAEYLLLNRVLIENYTNLEVETQGFFEEYDMLVESGIFEKLFIGNDEKNEQPLIPYKEMSEFKFILNMKKQDILTNTYNIPAYISNQVTRFGELAGTVLSPVIDKLSDELKNLDDEKIIKITKALEAGFAKK